MLLTRRSPGIILVASLLMMAALLAIALAFAVFILSDLRQAAATDNAIVAYYGAESGLERALFLLRRDQDDPAILDRASDLVALPTQTTGRLVTANALWDLADSADQQAVYARERLYNGQAVKLYLLDRAAGSNVAQAVGLSWERPAGGSSATRLQAILTQLTPQTRDGALIYYTDTNDLAPTPPTDWCLPLKDELLDGTTGAARDYVLELRTVSDTANDYVANLRVRAYGTDDCAPGSELIGLTNVSIVARGTHGGTEQTIYATLPPRDPISGVLGFVLFSEEDITKGN